MNKPQDNIGEGYTTARREPAYSINLAINQTKGGGRVMLNRIPPRLIEVRVSC